MVSSAAVSVCLAAWLSSGLGCIDYCSKVTAMSIPLSLRSRILQTFAHRNCGLLIHKHGSSVFVVAVNHGVSGSFWLGNTEIVSAVPITMPRYSAILRALVDPYVMEFVDAERV